MTSMACSDACLKTSGVYCNTALLSRGNYFNTLSPGLVPVKHSFGKVTLRSEFQHSFSSPCREISLKASSSSSWVEEDEATVVENGFECSPEGSSAAEDAKSDVMKEVMQRLSEEDLEEAAKKYKYEEELFAQVDFAQINAFASKPFSGNPAAVCYLPYDRDGNWLQLVAKEFNLPATAFVVKRRLSKKTRIAGHEGSPLIEADDSGKELKSVKKRILQVENDFDIRWFTTTSELELCGHATLASAHMLFSSGLVQGDTIIFHSKNGTLKARKVAGYDDDDADVDAENLSSSPEENNEEDAEARQSTKVELGKGVVELDFPLSVVTEVDSSEAQSVQDALGGMETIWVGRTAIGDYLVELPSSKHVEQLQPLFEKMKIFGGRGGVIATARASEDSKFDFISRFFVPKFGIDEDAVTGSAHCALGPYWATKLGKYNLQAYQASDRGGELRVRVDFGNGRVYLQGGAVLLMAGTLLNTFRT